MGSKIAKNAGAGARDNPDGAILEAVGPNVPPRWPRVAQDSPKMAQSKSQGAPQIFQDGFK